MTVKELQEKINQLLSEGKIQPDWKVVISDDEEGNGFHQPYYAEEYEQTEEDILEGCSEVEGALIIG